MIKEQSRFSINPLYVVAVALCCICSITTTFYQGLFFGLVVVVAALLSINLVSLVEKIADKNLRAFLITMLAALLIVVGEYVIEIVAKEFFIANIENLKWTLLSVVSLSIVPTYFETRLTTKHYFANMFFSLFAFLVMIMVYSIIIEFCAFGCVAGHQLFASFVGFDFAKQLFFQLFIIAILLIVANVIYQKIEDKRLTYNLLVERYKAHIKRRLLQKSQQKENENG